VERESRRWRSRWIEVEEKEFGGRLVKRRNIQTKFYLGTAWSRRCPAQARN